MYIIVTGICELVSLVVQPTLQWRTRPGAPDDITPTGTMRKRVAQRGRDDVTRVGRNSRSVNAVGSFLLKVL